MRAVFDVVKMGQEWGKNGTRIETVWHDWDILQHANFTEFHMMLNFNALNSLKKTHALGRSLVIFKTPVSRS